MRQAFALLGLMTLIVFGGAFLVFKEAGAPSDVFIIPEEKPMSLTLTSPAFPEGGRIPAPYTCDGDNVSPELHISGVPEGTQSLVLVMDDPDIPDSVKQVRGIETFDHWVVYNIEADTEVIQEGEALGMSGMTSIGKTGYVGPCPPDREHRYIFRLYAVSDVLHFEKTPTLAEVEAVAQGKSLESATLMGRYERTQ